MRPRILFFSNHLRGPHGSAGARSWHQAKRLAERFEVRVAIPAVDPVTARPVTPETWAGLPDGVDVRLLDSGPNERASLWRRARYYLRLIPRQLRTGLAGPRPDLVLTMSLPVTMLAIAWVSARRHGVPLVVDLRDMPFETAAEIGYVRARRLLGLLGRVETFLLRRAEAVVTVSPRYRDELIARGLDPARITFAPIGYDGFEEPAPEAVAEWRGRLEAGLGPGTRTIGVYCGTIGHAFPVDGILEGAAALTERPDIGVVLVGDGQRLEEFRARIAAGGLNVMTTGRLTKRDVAAICRAADFCLYPANAGRFSGAILGNKIYDYLGAGRPVVYLGGDSAVRDLLAETGTGLFAGPGDPAGLAAAMATLADDAAARAALTPAPGLLAERGLTAAGSAARLSEIVAGLVKAV